MRITTCPNHNSSAFKIILKRCSATTFTERFAADQPAECLILLTEREIGKVIGPKGSVIRMLRDTTKCTIDTDAKGARADGMRGVM